MSGSGAELCLAHGASVEKGQASSTSGLESLQGASSEGSAGRGYASRTSLRAREDRFGTGVPPGREANPPPAHGFFDPEPRAPARQGRTLRGRYGAGRRSPGCTGAGEAREADGRSLPEQVSCPASSAQDPGMRGQRLSQQRPEPSPASSTDASGASLVRQDPAPIAEPRTIVKNKKRTGLPLPQLFSAAPSPPRHPRPGAGDPRLLALRFQDGDGRHKAGHDGGGGAPRNWQGARAALLWPSNPYFRTVFP